MTSNSLLLAAALVPHGPPKKLKPWPKPPEDGAKWVDRLHPHFEKQWRTQGLWPLIMISKSRIILQSALIETLLRFWAPPCNSFIFPLGPMSITLYDVLMLTGLPIIGLDSPYTIEDQDAPVLAAPGYCYPSYAAVTEKWSTSTGDPSTIEHIMFLWVVICHYIFYPASGKPLSEYLPLACSLSTGKTYNLGAMLLGSLYCGLNKTVAEEPISKLGGVSWVLQVWAAAYFPKLRDFPAGLPTIMLTTTLMGSRTSLSAHELLAFFQNLAANQVQFPARPNPKSILQPDWIGHHHSVKGRSTEDLADFILTHCVHHRFLIVGRCALRESSSWLFEFYNPSLFARQFGLTQTIPHSTLYFPVDLSHIASEVVGRRLSKATVDLLAVLPDRFRCPVHEMTTTASDPFGPWWDSLYARLVHGLPLPSDTRKRQRLDTLEVSASINPIRTDVKKKTKVTIQSTSSKPEVQRMHKCYKTRSSSRLISRFSNTTKDPITIDNRASTDSDLEVDEENPAGEESAEEAEEAEKPSDETVSERSVSETQDSKKQPASMYEHGDSDLHAIDRNISSSQKPLDLSSRRARLRNIQRVQDDTDLSFADPLTSDLPGYNIQAPSAESLAHARTAVNNFLDLGLEHLGESQRASMLSSIAILQTASDFATSEHGQSLNALPNLFSQLDTARHMSFKMCKHLNHFKSERGEKKDLDVEDEAVCSKIAQVTATYDMEEAELQRLEEGLKDNYQEWVKNLQEAERTQSECLAKWEYPRQLNKKYDIHLVLATPVKQVKLLISPPIRGVTEAMIMDTILLVREI